MKDNLTYEQIKAIELESQNKLPELAEHMKELGRAKQTENLLKEMKKEDDNKEEELIEGEFTYIDRSGNKPKEKVSIPKIVDHLMMIYDFKTIYNTRDEIVFVYDEGIYINKGKELIKTEVERLLDTKCVSSIANEVFEKIKRKTNISQDKFDIIPTELICCENGIYDIKEDKFKRFSPEFYFTSKISSTYKEDVIATNFLKFIEETLYPEDIPIVQEWFGFCLYRKYFLKKAMIIFGEKNTGKTILLNILIRFMGQKNVSGISLQRIASKDKFSISFLKNKLANIYDDLSSDDLKDAGGFKIATGGGFATGEHKFGDSFQFLNYAKNLFATNHIPNVKDIDDDAYYERWIPLPFDNMVSKEKLDPFLMDKLTTEEELSGILNWALKGLKRLLNNGKFSYNKSSDEIKLIMQRQNNPLVLFTEEILHQEDGNNVTKEIMFQTYSKWCQENKVPRMTKEQLGRNLGKYSNYIIAKGGKERTWENVQIHERYRDILFSTGNGGLK